jgi:hypothetical protein
MATVTNAVSNADPGATIVPVTAADTRGHEIPALN